MPTYEYACTKCDQHVEVFQRVSDEPLTICGVCGGPLRKVFHPAGILFKGSGFYSTDNRSKSSGDGSKKSSEKSSEGSSEKSSESSSEKKPAEKKADSKSTEGKSSSGDKGSSSPSSGSAKERSA